MRRRRRGDTKRLAKDAAQHSQSHERPSAEYILIPGEPELSPTQVLGPQTEAAGSSDRPQAVAERAFGPQQVDWEAMGEADDSPKEATTSA